MMLVIALATLAAGFMIGADTAAGVALIVIATIIQANGKF